MKLDFFLIGAQKSGSTSIYRYLLSHPHVFVPRRENSNYYSYGQGTIEIFERPGILAKSWTNAVRGREDYLALFRDRTSEVIAGDCSDSQYFYPGTAARIHAEHPDTKIVAVLRHPVERAYSGFNHARSSGMELESDFSRCMQRSLEEEAALSPIMRYKSLGMYGALLGPFLSTFGRQKMLLLNFADVTSDFGKVALEISRFLSIPVFEVNHVWANQTLVPPASGPGAWLYTIARPFRSALKGTTSESKTRLAITRVKEHVFERPQKLSERVQSKYMPLFRKDISRLSTDFGPGFWDNWR